MKLLTWNIQNFGSEKSDTHNPDKFCAFFGQVILENEIDILVLQECKTIGEHFQALLDGLNFVETALNSGTNWVRIFYSSKTIVLGACSKFDQLEKLRVTTMIYKKGNKTPFEFTFVGVHFYSIATKNHHHHNLELCKIIKNHLEETDSPFIIGGDFNINFIDNIFHESYWLNSISNKKIFSFCNNNQKILYNPMPNFVGDWDWLNDCYQPVNGSFFNNIDSSGRDITKIITLPYWNAVDGFLVSESLSSIINFRESCYIYKLNTGETLLNGYYQDKYLASMRTSASAINTSIYPDHIPFLFAINL